MSFNDPVDVESSLIAVAPPRAPLVWQPTIGDGGSFAPDPLGQNVASTVGTPAQVAASNGQPGPQAGALAPKSINPLAIAQVASAQAVPAPPPATQQLSSLSQPPAQSPQVLVPLSAFTPLS